MILVCVCIRLVDDLRQFQAVGDNTHTEFKYPLCQFADKIFKFNLVI